MEQKRNWYLSVSDSREDKIYVSHLVGTEEDVRQYMAGQIRNDISTYYIGKLGVCGAVDAVEAHVDELHRHGNGLTGTINYPDAKVTLTAWPVENIDTVELAG